jgi:hypothetical protein
MALGFYFSPDPPFTAQQYDEAIKRLRKAGAAHPQGRLYHACFGTSDRLSVFDVWTSQAAFDRFGQILMPILHEVGANPGQPQVMEIHNVIRPPAARPRPAAKKRPTAKRAAPKKSKTRGRSSKKR